MNVLAPGAWEEFAKIEMNLYDATLLNTMYAVECRVILGTRVEEGMRSFRLIPRLLTGRFVRCGCEPTCPAWNQIDIHREYVCEPMRFNSR